jgi:hypothetical protein
VVGAVLVGGAFLGAAACSNILGIRELTNFVEAGVEAGPDVEAGPFVCEPAHPPTRGGGNGDGPPLILAFNLISGGLEQNVKTDFGWDLDDHCTCQDTVKPEACVRPNPNAPETCDRPNGRDLAGNLALRQATTLVAGVSDTNLAAQLEAGKFGAVMIVRNYDGSLNDSSVRVDFAPSYGTVSVPDGGVPAVDGKGKLVPVALKHDGTDVWSFAPQFATKNGGLLDAIARDDNAYVRGGVLVANFKTAWVVVQFDLTNGNPLAIRVDDVIVSANVSKTAKGIELVDGRIGGRSSISTMLQSFEVWSDPTGVGDMCPNTGSIAFSAIQGGLCRNRDIRGFKSEDGKGLPCDAISFGIAFGAEPALLYGPANYPYAKTQCFKGTLDLDGGVPNPCE